MRRILGYATALPVSVLLLAGAGAGAGAGVGAGAASASVPGDDGFTIKDPRITESSGLAASRAHPGIYWTHNDGDDGPYLYAVDGRTGETVARITYTGVGKPHDVEAVSVGPDGHLYVGAIGDNDKDEDHVWIYRLKEPSDLSDRTVAATEYHVAYEDGAHNAESLAVHPGTGRIYVITKDKDGGALYEAPEEPSPDGDNTLGKVADIDLWVTDAAFSPDGTRLAIRGDDGIMYTWKNGKPSHPRSLDVPKQKQGEAITFTTDGRTLLYGSEGRNSGVVARPAKAGAAIVDEADGLSGMRVTGVVIGVAAGVALLLGGGGMVWLRKRSNGRRGSAL
ncbi:WD40 repeat domain-containing protein [Streptomyces sp. NBC_00006]|uniref:WD40 repeat domain-containing protein n=1 Tax=Streptomyces sp. NBC_00006 TaxID=2975619 RepID=UPI002257C4E2|nr:WD40 repeat domain-containing protein [Streptomyces sp. NBC_00006]MCX5529111.1 WD40 repeat domain-containing protein [Streptomyces sp. NBC_00006]